MSVDSDHPMDLPVHAVGDDLVRKLEDLLVQARMGELYGFAWTAIDNRRTINRGSVLVNADYGPHLSAAIGDLFYSAYAERDATYSS